MSKTVIKLKHPIVVGSEEIKELVCERRLQAGDLIGVNINDMKFDDMLTIIKNLFAIPPHIVNKIDFEDLSQCMEVVNGFLSVGQ